MKTLITTIAVSFIITLGLAQNPANTSNMQDGVRVNRSKMKGTPFFSDNWASGYGMLSNGSKTNTMLLNYELMQDEIVYKDTDGQVMTMMDSELAGFVLTTPGESFVFSKSDLFEYSDDQPKMKYVQIYDAPSRKILVEYYKDLDDPNSSGWTSSNTNTLRAEYKDKTNIYIKNIDGKYEEIKLKNKDLLSAYNSNEGLKAYLKNNKIKDLNDLKQAFSYIEQNITQ